MKINDATIYALGYYQIGDEKTAVLCLVDDKEVVSYSIVLESQ